MGHWVKQWLLCTALILTVGPAMSAAAPAGNANATLTVKPVANFVPGDRRDDARAQAGRLADVSRQLCRMGHTARSNQINKTTSRT
jgi:hypothetical protein